jgi:hypothetical protein
LNAFTLHCRPASTVEPRQFLAALTSELSAWAQMMILTNCRTNAGELHGVARGEKSLGKVVTWLDLARVVGEEKKMG